MPVAGVRFFLFLLVFLALSFFAVSSTLQWNENKALRASTEAEMSLFARRQAELALGLLQAEKMDVVSAYPLFEFAKRHGFSQIMAISGSGYVLNDTLVSGGKLQMPGWLDWPKAKKALEAENIYRVSFRKGGLPFEAVLLPYEPGAAGARPDGALVLAFVFERPVPPGFPFERFIVMIVGATIFLALVYAFLKIASKARGEPAEPSEVGFVVETFHDLVGKLKEKEAELDALRRTAEQRADLIESSSEYILESVSSGVVSLDEELRITKVNGRAEKILGLKRSEAVGKEARLYLPAPMMERLEKRQTVERGEMALEGKGLTGTMWLGFSVTPLLDPSGNRVGQVLVFTDLTGLRVLERQAEFRRRLSSLGEMAAGVAHELRNPMAVIAGYSKMLSRNAPANLKPAALSIEKEIAAMDAIIKGFLTFARPVEPKKAPLDLKGLLLAAISSVIGSGGGTEVVFSFDGPERMEADELLLRQAFINIIQNAAQAMPEGGRLTVKCFKREGEAVITFSDTGGGIPEDIRDKIFLPFYTTKEGGTGLGLAIAHGIVQSHGGMIEVESSSSGTTFTVRLPL